MKSLIFGLVVCFAVDGFAWNLVDQEIQLPGSLCHSIVFLKQDLSGIKITSEGTSNGLALPPVAVFENINKGRVCRPQDSSHTFGGMVCGESRANGSLYIFASCSTEVLGLKCQPFSKRDVVRTLEMQEKALILTATVKYYNGKTYTDRCTYNP